MLYSLVRPLLYLLGAETAHHLIIFFLRFASATPGARWLLRHLFRVPTSLRSTVFGLDFAHPVGLAAGFDKDARVFPALWDIGFSCVEVGTITGDGQPGNPRPRLFRLKADRALVNRMGFNNGGAELARDSLAALLRRGRQGGQVLGVNIGKTKLVPPGGAPRDYEKSARLLAPFADYLVVNVSSPNTPGLRDLQAVEALRPILTAVRSALDQAAPGRRVPLLVKIAPDLSNDDVATVARLALEVGLDGIICTNTTIARDGLTTPPEQILRVGSGGLSGAPLKERAVEVLQILRGIVGSRIALVSVGGIETVEDAWQRIVSGASLIQIYSALVYEGPGLPSRLARGLALKLKQNGFSSLQEAVGSSTASTGTAPFGAEPDVP